MVVVAARRGASDMAGQGALHPQQQGAQRSRAGNGAAPWWLILLDRPRRSVKEEIRPLRLWQSEDEAVRVTSRITTWKHQNQGVSGKSPAWYSRIGNIDACGCRILHGGAWTYFGERAKENFCRIMAITNFASNIAKF
uniref:Uncharacterized protein n=1 Tax=Oryza nivara TaxID=4536 RepID=A0A0E0H7Q3_ORYNI